MHIYTFYAYMHVNLSLMSPPLTVEISEDQQTRKAKAIYSEVAIAKEWASVTWVFAKTQGQAEWESFIVHKGEGSGVPCLAAVGLGKLVG